MNYVFGHKHKQVGNYPVVMHMGVGNHSYLIDISSLETAIICVTNKFQPYLHEVMPLLNLLLGVKEHRYAEGKKSYPEKSFSAKQDLNLFTGTYKWQLPLTFQSTVGDKTLR